MTESIDPPYPSDTRAKGWRFDLDYEQIEQSSTWALAGSEAKPWLLMLWFTAWKQVPCASLPADEEVIAAMIGMPAKTWAKHSKVMLRGWSKSSDGRMYHNVLTAKVREMLAKRRSESERKAAYRQGTPALSHGTDTGQTQDSHGKAADSTRKATPTPTPTEKKKKRASAHTPLPEGFGISPRVFAWAESKGHGRLEDRLEHFVSYAKRSGKTYADWDEALMTAIREDWAKLGSTVTPIRRVSL